VLRGASFLPSFNTALFPVLSLLFRRYASLKLFSKNFDGSDPSFCFFFHLLSSKPQCFFLLRLARFIMEQTKFSSFFQISPMSLGSASFPFFQSSSGSRLFFGFIQPPFCRKVPPLLRFFPFKARNKLFCFSMYHYPFLHALLSGPVFSADKALFPRACASVNPFPKGVLFFP